ncbi:MAG: hypothetical protein Q9209_001786 [Squamulea sp. 1 TL-2023]
MGIQAYLTRLALGRSPYEPLDYEVPQAVPPVGKSQQQIENVDTLQIKAHDDNNDSYVQQYDDRGYPQNLRSHNLSHQSRKAQNDVLATIGVLHVPNQESVQEIRAFHAKQGPTSAETYGDLNAESEFGLDITVAFLIPESLLHGRITCARQRMQTFRFYTGVPLHRALQAEWKTLGPSLLLLGGFPGDFLIRLLFDCQDLLYRIAQRAYGGYVANKTPGIGFVFFKRLWEIGAPTVQVWPDNPDLDSIVVAMNRDGNVPGLGCITDEGLYFNNITTIRKLVERDWTAFKEHFKPLTSWWRSSVAGTQSSELNVSLRGTSSMLEYANNGHLDRRRDNKDEAEPVASVNTLDPQFAETGFQGAEFVRDTNPRASRSRSSDWRVNVESSEMVLTAPRSWREPTKSTDSSMPTYRVTYLTALMAETVAGSLSTLIADLTLLPLEALFVRSVALAYLDTAGGASYSNMGLRNDIYPLGSWFGMGLRSGRAMDYVRKMVLCFGIDMLLNFGLWQMTAGTAWWFGRKRFRWGKH